ncbi:Death-associated protein kinase 1 (DAP kinase 1) [Durusdinium trenchii]|uniref:Death-associated protein kinase 1 (DAP kinase 1) n=1 Tax=Durusdinium trenchii TaxID=1381693 RepID=A0ABP0IWN4_9DINO
MACLRFFMMLLLGAAAEHSMDESLVDTLRRGFESLELPKLFGLGPLAGYLQLVISTAAPDLCALLVAGAVFYFLGSAMQVARREMKPAEEVEDEMGDWSQAPEISGCSPLHLAAHNGRLEHLEELLSSGAAVNATDNYNETPLHMAARGGYVDICDVLLHYGADPRVLNKNQKTPLLLAALSGHADVCDLLSPLKLARRPPPKGLITAEKDSSSDSTAASTPRDSVEEDCSFGCNDLHWAALRCSLADLHAGLAKGILVDTQDPWGDTALHLAARAGSEEICSVLCAAKANPLVLNKDKKTALEVARIGGHLMIADLLEDFC